MLKRTPSLTPPPWPPDPDTLAIIQVAREFRDNPELMIATIDCMVDYCLELIYADQQ